MKLRFLLLLLLVLIGFKAQALPHGLSGFYGPVQIGVNLNDEIVTGHFADAVGYDPITKGPRQMCAFAFKGKFKNSWKGYKIQAQEVGGTEVVKGRLTFLAAKDLSLSIKIELDKPFPVCEGLSHKFAKDSPEYPMTKRAHWIGVRVVKSQKAHLHNKPDANAKHHHYATHGVVLTVREQQKGWIIGKYVGEYQGKTGDIIGWFSENDLY